MHETLDPTIAALLGAIIGGLLSVLASWLAQRIQSRSLLLAQEIRSRRELYSEFIEAATLCFADALLHSELDPERVASLYGAIGRMELHSTPKVLEEANGIAHKILDAYANPNRSNAEVRDMLARDALDLYGQFGTACRVELEALNTRQ